MKLSILSAVTAAFIAVTASSASALPVAKPSQAGAETTAMTEQVRHKRGHYGNRHGNRHWRHRGHDHRYDKYRGWNRYSKRPYNYRSRGCVAVGPIWFCK